LKYILLVNRDSSRDSFMQLFFFLFLSLSLSLSFNINLENRVLLTTSCLLCSWFSIHLWGIKCDRLLNEKWNIICKHSHSREGGVIHSFWYLKSTYWFFVVAAFSVMLVIILLLLPYFFLHLFLVWFTFIFVVSLIVFEQNKYVWSWKKIIIRTSTKNIVKIKKKNSNKHDNNLY